MEKEFRRIPDANMESVAGAGTDDDGFKIIVEYDISGKTDPTVEHYEMTYWVGYDETIESIETRTWRHSFADGADCQTFYKGTPCAKGITMRALGIKPYEKLNMTVLAWGGGW